MQRKDGRLPDELRPVRIERGVQEYAEGSVMISTGRTRVLCSASVQDRVPRWIYGSGEGWVTAEYALLPRSTHDRTRRETDGLGGRTQEIRRLIGRSLRAAVDLKELGERMIVIDCDVIQADGGTRTASITGGFMALALALDDLYGRGKVSANVLQTSIAAVSVGISGRRYLLDLDYSEDSRADVDSTIVMTSAGRLVEVTLTAEGNPFTHDDLDHLMKLGEKGNQELFEHQRTTLLDAGVSILPDG